MNLRNRLSEHHVEIEERGLHHLVMTESDQPPREVCRPIHCALNLSNGLDCVFGTASPKRYLFARTENDGKQVVDIVSHTTRQPAQRFHLFCFLSCFFHSLLGCYVCNCFDNVGAPILCDSFRPLNEKMLLVWETDLVDRHFSRAHGLGHLAEGTRRRTSGNRFITTSPGEIS